MADDDLKVGDICRAIAGYTDMPQYAQLGQLVKVVGFRGEFVLLAIISPRNEAQKEWTEDHPYVEHRGQVEKI